MSSFPLLLLLLKVNMFLLFSSCISKDPLLLSHIIWNQALGRGWIYTMPNLGVEERKQILLLEKTLASQYVK